MTVPHKEEYREDTYLRLGIDHTGNLLEIVVDDFSADWLRIKAEAAHTSPVQLINELVREKVAAAEA